MTKITIYFRKPIKKDPGITAYAVMAARFTREENGILLLNEVGEKEFFVPYRNIGYVEIENIP